MTKPKRTGEGAETTKLEKRFCKAAGWWMRRGLSEDWASLEAAYKAWEANRRASRKKGRKP